MTRSYPIPRLFAWTIVAFFAIAGSIALAQESAKDFVEPRMTRAQFTLFSRQLNLDSTQRITAEMFFSDYAAALDELINTLDEDAKKAGAAIVQDAMMGKARLTAEELREKRVAVLRVYQSGLGKIDSITENLLIGIESILTPDQLIQFESNVRELHRALYLHPRQLSADAHEYAGDGVDVLMLIEEATAEGGELKSLDRELVRNILVDYEHRLDAYLLRTAAQFREGALLRKIAGIEKNQSALRETESAAVARWKELYELNKQAVAHIGEVAAANLGEPAKRKWLDRFDQASFKWLYPRRKPDRQIEWLRQQSVESATLEQAEAVYDGYVSRRRELARQAIDIMLRVRLEFQSILYSMMDRRTMDERIPVALHDELLKNSGEQTLLENNTAASIEALLPNNQREALRKAMANPDLRRR